MGSDARMGATARHGGSCLQEAAGRSVWKGAGAACHLHGKNKGRHAALEAAGSEGSQGQRADTAAATLWERGLLC